MRLGLINSAWAQAGRDTAFGIRMTKEIGFDSIDIFADPLDIDIRERKLIKDACDKLGLPIVSVPCVAAALLYPHLFLTVGGYKLTGLIVPLIQIIMFGMGTTLSVGDFARVLVMPRGVLVGATEWCTHPADLDVARVRGTKNPDVKAIVALSPDLVVTNKEENRELDVRRLRESGVAVWVTDIETVPDSVASMERLLDAMGWSRPAWLGEARDLWCGPVPTPTRSVAVRSTF